MNEEQLMDSIRIPGRYEIESLGGGIFILTPLESNEILITKESEAECNAHFRSKDS